MKPSRPFVSLSLTTKTCFFVFLMVVCALPTYGHFDFFSTNEFNDSYKATRGHAISTHSRERHAYIYNV